MRLLYFLFVLFCVSFAFSQPEIKFDFTEYDFGDVVETDGDFIVKYGFTNIGNEPLLINQVQGSGGGQVASWPKETILPGEKDCITVKYFGHRIGVFNKIVTVYSNAKNREEPIVLRIKGRVLFKQTTIDVDKELIQLDSIAFGELDSTSFLVTNTGKAPLHFNYLWMFPHPCVDLFSIRLSLYDATGLKIKPIDRPRYGEIVAESGETIRVQLSLRNNYGNIGQVNRYLYFIYNSLDTLKMTLQTKYVGIPWKDEIYEANTCFEYMNEKLTRCTRFNADKTVSDVINFHDGHPVSTIKYDWPRRGKSTFCTYKDDLQIGEITEKEQE